MSQNMRGGLVSEAGEGVRMTERELLDICFSMWDRPRWTSVRIVSI